MFFRGRYLLFCWLMLLPFVALAGQFTNNTGYEVCFTPQHDCTYLLNKVIASAQHAIEVQAYSFTSYAIAKALIKAQQRGVKVRVILDKSNFVPKARTVAKYLFEHGIPIWQDAGVAIAHNKVVIVDDATIETGSFNFTTSAQKYNAENMLIIHDAILAKQYLANWQSRLRVSVRMFYEHDRWHTL